MCNPESEYLPFKNPEYFDSIYLTHFDNSEYQIDYNIDNKSLTTRDHFSGIKFDIWNNRLLRFILHGKFIYK